MTARIQRLLRCYRYDNHLVGGGQSVWIGLLQVGSIWQLLILIYSFASREPPIVSVQYFEPGARAKFLLTDALIQQLHAEPNYSRRRTKYSLFALRIIRKLAKMAGGDL